MGARFATSRFGILRAKTTIYEHRISVGSDVGAGVVSGEDEQHVRPAAESRTRPRQLRERNNHLDSVVVQIAQASEMTILPSDLNDMKEPSSKSRAQKYL
jgi:hypothetical protein